LDFALCGAVSYLMRNGGIMVGRNVPPVPLEVRLEALMFVFSSLFSRLA
jgi:hypothetical protein